MQRLSTAPLAAQAAEGSSTEERIAPQQLMLAFLGAFVLDDDRRRYLTAGVFIDIFLCLKVSEAVTRATLNRMVRTGLLHRAQTGRIASFGITENGQALLRQGRERVASTGPFTPVDDEWTLLSYSIPEAQRDLRHQLRSRLQWAGFGRLRDGLWIAPGTKDIREVLGQSEVANVVTVAFAGHPIGGTSPHDFVRSAWDLELIESEHHRFIASWTDLSATANPVASFTALGADWLRLLRVDPGLPEHCLPTDWPAERSVAVHENAVAVLAVAADETLEQIIRSRAGRK